MLVVALANEIWAEVSFDSSTSISAISYFLRNKVGELNSLTLSNFSINSSYEIVDESGNSISIEAAAILKKIYRIWDYDYQIRNNLNSITSENAILRVNNLGYSVEKLNRNEISKTLAALKQAEVAELKNLVNAYKQNNSLSLPSQIVGDDTTQGIYDRNYYDSRLRIV